MLIGSDPLNVSPLGASAGGSAPEPVAVGGGQAFVWREQVLVDAVDVSAIVSGEVAIDRERGAAAIADVSLYMAADPNPLEWVGREVIINYHSTAAGVTTTARRFTGRIEETSWDPLTRLLACACSDQLQQQVERLSVAEVDALIPCHWSVDVFEPPEGRSRWEYAEERLSTVRASLDCDVYGDLRLSTWYAGGVQFDFGAGSSVYESVSVSYANLGELINVVEIDAEYRFPRLRQQVETFNWRHPGTSGYSGIQAFCAWRTDSSELPDREMIRAAVEGAGLKALPGSYLFLPPTMPDPCGTGAAWINNYSELVLVCGISGARRWVQQVTDSYALRVEAPGSVAAVGEQIARDGSAVDAASGVADEWEDSLDKGSAGMPAVNKRLDLTDEPRRQSFVRCLLQQAVTSIVRAHNATLVSWAVPTSWVLAVDLGNTLRLQDQGVKALGRCCRVQDSFDKVTGRAITTLTVAVMRGGGSETDPLEPPPAPVEPGDDDDDDGGITPSNNLPTQLGGAAGSGTYDEDIDGFSGNLSNFDPTYERFPRRFAVTAPEVPAEHRDELKRSASGTYRVAIPNDLLEL